MEDDITEQNSEIIDNTQSSKEEVLRILKEENPLENGNDKYSQMILLIEIKKVNAIFGILKGEYFQNDKLENKFSVLLPLQTATQPVWNTLKDGESTFYGFTLDSRAMKVPEKVMDFVSRSFDGATIQDFIPGCGRRSD